MSVVSSKAPKSIQDYEYISNDPAENADNFDPKWARLRELTTDEERYNAIRERWGNPEIPDPKINLTFRHKKTQVLNGKENCLSPMLPHKNKKQRSVSRRRSRSCTRPYEQLISNLEKNYQHEYSQLMYKHKAEIQELLQVQIIEMNSCLNLWNFPAVKNDLHVQQEQQVITLLSGHFQEVRKFIGKKCENIDACKRYMEEVKAFFNFYQKINDHEVTLQMTDEQHEHTVETEKMYELYSKFYK